MKPWTKAGIVGGILQIVFTLPTLLVFILPFEIGSLLAICTCCVFLLLYPVPGILGAYWMPSPRETGQVVRTGAFAGLLAAGIDSIVTLILTLGTSWAGLYERYFEQLNPNAMEILRQRGMDFWFSTGGLLLQTSIGLVFHIITCVLLSILGGVIYTGFRKE
jgi:hypothetical protein